MDIHWLSHFYVLQIFVFSVLASSALGQRKCLLEFRFFYHKEVEYFLHTFISTPVELIQHQSLLHRRSAFCHGMVAIT
jgi:hypothetical protein